MADAALAKLIAPSGGVIGTGKGSKGAVVALDVYKRQALGRPCNGCAGLSPDSNVEAARYVVGKRGLEVARFDDALEMFNAVAISAAQGEE